MWKPQWEMLNNEDGLRLLIERDQRPASFAEVFGSLRDDAEFQRLFNVYLADVPYPAFRWELPGLTEEVLQNPFECVVLNDQRLERRPEAEAFAEHFTNAKHGIAVFPNLGNNALLVVPMPDPEAEYPVHLGTFVRSASQGQRLALWQTVGTTMIQRLGTKPVWLNTAGAGVAWLHVRLDDRPKYYRYEPYKHDSKRST